MKKTCTSLFLIFLALIGSSAFVIKSSSGIAGYTGSPGEATCSNCHGGGSAASSGITITAVPAFSVNINSDTEYMPDSVYQITIQTSASGFSNYGFACEILNPNSTNSGTMSAPGTGVKFLNLGPKRNAVHTTPKAGTTASFTFKWTAPSGDNATIYAIGNAVNKNNNDNGDFVIPPVSLNLVPAPVPVDTTNYSSIKENTSNTSAISRVSVFPNPANETATLSYYLKESKSMRVELVNMNGSIVKLLHEAKEAPGAYSQVLHLREIESGVYFVKTSANNSMVSQKLIVIP